LTTAIIFEKKPKKSTPKDTIVIDLDDLESYGNFRHGIEFIKFPSHTIADKTIMEWFAVNGISYWWFAAPILHPKYNEAVLFIKRFSTFLEEHSIDLIKLQGVFDKIDLIKQISKQKNIKLEISNKYFLFCKKNKINELAKKSIYKKIMKEKIKKRNHLFDKLGSSIDKLDNPVIFTSPDIYRRETYDFTTKKSKKEEFFIKPFLDIVEENNISSLCFDFDYTLKGTTCILEERLTTPYNWIPIENLLKKSKSKQTKKTISSLKNSINLLLKNGKENLLVYQKISLTEYMKQSFKDLFLEPNLPTYIHLIELLENYLKKIKPIAIIQVYETGTYAKAFEVAAKKLGIKTLGIQHGLIPTDYPDYMFKEIKNENFPLGNFIPDKTLVYGEYYKKILTEIGGYPKDKIQVIGNPTYFNFEKIKNSFNKYEILKKNDFKNEKIILFPLSMRFFYFENSPDRIILNILFDGFKDRDDVKILVRPHPGDKLDQNTLNNYFPDNNFLISINTLFEDIFVSDVVVILPISSVSSEVPIFEKPLLLVNVEKDNSVKSIDDAYLQLVEHDVAKLISSSEIVSTINLIDKGEIWKNNDSQKRKEFLQNYFNYGNPINLLHLIE
jgi:hypothetical protein